jgi:hypothetical protein
LHACAHAEHGADDAVQATWHCPREAAGRHHRGRELWQSAVLCGKACAAAAVEELWREMAAVGREGREAAGWRASRPARLPQRSSIEESAPGRGERCGCGPYAAVLNAVSADGWSPHHAHRNVGRSGGQKSGKAGRGRVDGNKIVGTDGLGLQCVAAPEDYRGLICDAPATGSRFPT